MSFLRLAINNILRHRTRSLLTMLGVAASVAVLFSIISFNRGFERGLSREVERTGLHFMVVPSGCPHEVASLVLHGAVIPKFLDESVMAKLKASEGLDLVSPMLVAQMPNPLKDRVDLIYGLEMSHVERLKPSWKIKGRVPQGPDGVLLGSEIASHDKLAPGDTITYKDRTFKVEGIIESTGSQDDAFVYMPIGSVQALLDKVGRVTAIGVKVKDAGALNRITDELSSAIPGIQIVTMGQVINSLSTLANSAKTLSLSIAVIAVLISAVGVMNSILMAVFERTQEIGMMRAIGAENTDIFRITIKETVLVTLCGGVAGIVLAVLGSSLIEAGVRGFMPFVPQGDMIVFEPGLAALSVLFSIGVGVLSGLYPAWKASRINPIEAIKG